MNSPKNRPARIWIVAGLLFGPVLYILSIGPVFRWASSQDEPDAIPSLITVVYSPAVAMMDLPIIGPGLDWYCTLWMDPEFAWSQVCEWAANEQALQFLGVSKNVGVGRAFVGGTPTMGVDFDFNVHDSKSFEAAIQQANFEMEAKASKSRIKLSARPPAGPDPCPDLGEIPIDPVPSNRSN